MTAEHLALLEASIDEFIQIKLLDSTSLLVKPIFVYKGEDNPDVFVLPMERQEDGTLMAGKHGLSILLNDIAEVRPG